MQSVVDCRAGLAPAVPAGAIRRVSHTYKRLEMQVKHPQMCESPGHWPELGLDTHQQGYLLSPTDIDSYPEIRNGCRNEEGF